MLLKLIISILYIYNVDSVSSQCDLPLNSSNCGLRPKMVYTYYGPKAFCYPAVWRGCPTSNKFKDEHDCLITCTKNTESNFILGVKEMSPMPKSGTVEASKVHRLKIKPVKCDVPLNTSRCTEHMKQVFTYSNEKGACVADIWFGCPSENVFTDISSCQHHCLNKELERKEKLATEKCAVPLNTNRCGRKFKKLVYTYNIEERACVEAIWFGCPSNNIFTDISSCRKTCHKTLGEEMKPKDTYEENQVSDSPKKTTEKTDPLKKGNIPVSVKIKPVKCDVPLNTSRCTEQMKQVFTYSNEEGACVADIWFGCPSENIYTDILSCKHNCPNRWNKELDRMEQYLATEICAVPLNTKRCSRKIKTVYTYNIYKKTCVTALWFGCPSNNIFTDIISCRKTCHKPWEQELEKMVKIEICDIPVDTSNCRKQLKQIYTYNMEKQACVKASWLGCPSKNVFTDIESCQKICHKKLDEGLKEMDKSHKEEFSEIAKKLIMNTDVTTKGDKLARPKGCDAHLNTSRCTKHMKQVYTYNNEKGACVRALWFGCPSENLFVDILSCRRNCHVKVDKMTTIAIPKNTGKLLDYNEKAYFIYKLEEANRGAGERFDDTDIMLIAQDKFYVL